MVQKDLFSQETKDRTPNGNRLHRLARFLDRYLQIRMDRFLMIALGLVLILVLVYSVGFERGVAVSMEKGTKLLIKEWLEPRAHREAAKTILVTKKQSLKKRNVAGTENVTTSSSPSESVPAFVLQGDEPRDFYTLQLVTYVSEGRAQREAEILSDKGWEGFVLPSGRYYVVCTNYYDSKKDAVEGLKEIKKGAEYSDAFIRRISR